MKKQKNRCVCVFKFREAHLSARMTERDRRVDLVRVCNRAHMCLFAIFVASGQGHEITNRFTQGEGCSPYNQGVRGKKN